MSHLRLKLFQPLERLSVTKVRIFLERSRSNALRRVSDRTPPISATALTASNLRSSGNLGIPKTFFALIIWVNASTDWLLPLSARILQIPFFISVPSSFENFFKNNLLFKAVTPSSERIGPRIEIAYFCTSEISFPNLLIESFDIFFV